MSKLDEARKRRKEADKRPIIKFKDEEQTQAIESVKKSIDNLYQLINDKEEFDFQILVKEIKTLHDILDFKAELKALNDTIKENKPDKMPIDKFTEIIKAVKENKPVPIKVDFSKLEKAIIQVQEKIQESSTVDQATENFKPVRRVIKVGNRLVYDDQRTPSRGGGGGSNLPLVNDAVPVVNPDGSNISGGSSGGDGTIVDGVDDTIKASVKDLSNSNPIAAAIVDASGDQITTFGTPGGATAAKQDTGNTSLASIDGKIPASPSTSGKQDTGNTSLASIDGKITAVNTGAVTISTALPAGSNNIGDVDVLSLPAIPAGNNNIGDVDIASALPAGTNAIGKLAANSGVDIGDVDVTSIIPGTGATNLGKAEDVGHTTGDTGVMVLGVRNDGAATSFSGANTDYTPLGVDAQGRQNVVQKAPTATCSNVASSATSVTVLAANTSRIGAQFYNDSSQLAYLKFGATASTSSFTVVLNAADYYELPGGYTGILDCIWASANGNMRVTELT